MTATKRREKRRKRRGRHCAKSTRSATPVRHSFGVFNIPKGYRVVGFVDHEFTDNDYDDQICPERTKLV